MSARRLACIVATALPGFVSAAGFNLVEDGKPRVSIYAPGENQSAARRLITRVESWTGVNLPLDTQAPTRDSQAGVVAIGTPKTNEWVRRAFDTGPAALGEEGYL